MFVERFGGLPAECLAWSVVERVGDGLDLLVVPSREVGAIREVLAQKAIGVILIGAALPGTLRVGEVDRNAGLDGELGADARSRRR
jgi:hypothetical protein